MPASSAESSVYAVADTAFDKGSKHRRSKRLYRVRYSKPAGPIDKHRCRQDQTSPATNVPSNGFRVRPDYLLGPLIGAKPTHGTHV